MLKKTTFYFFSLEPIVLIFVMFERSLQDSYKDLHNIYLFPYEKTNKTVQ